MRLCADLGIWPGPDRWAADDFSWRGHHTDNLGWSAPRTKADLPRAYRPRADRPAAPILAVARLQ